MRKINRALFGILAAAIVSAPSYARRGDVEVPSAEELQMWKSANQLFQETKRDKVAAIEAYERFLRNFPNTSRAADAQFMAGEAYLEQALKILRKEAESKKTSSTRLLAPKNTAAISALNSARDAYRTLLSRYRKKNTGLRSSAQYRIGEVAYNQKEWGQAIEAWREVEEKFRKSYIVPEAWMGIIFANLALEQFSQAEANLFLLGETYPHYLKVPQVMYVQGIISLHKGDYANAERALKRVKTAEAQFYLGKTFLLSKRPYLAAAAFERLVKDYPDSVLREETEFFIGDSFFLAKDFNGAITKYRRFLGKYPRSPLRVSALFRIGSSYFQKENYVEARAHFQSVIDRYPRDFFAPLAQYFIAESYLTSDNFREALFAYTKVITQYPETIKISPLAHYKLAWTQYKVSDYVQAAQTCRNFLSLYPSNTLAKNVYIIMANSLLAVKRYDEAVTAFQRIIDLAPTSDVAEQALFSILQTQHKLKRFNAILTSYQFIFRHLPPSQSKWRPLSYLYAAEAYLAQNRVDEAKAIYEMVLKVYPNDQAAFYAQDGLAWTYQIIGDDDRALIERRKLQDMLELARSSFSFQGGNQLGIADSMYNQKAYEDAYKLYEQFYQSNAEDKRAPQALYRAGMSLYKLQYYTQAIETWTKLRDTFPTAPETPKAEFQIGDTLYRAQKYDEAVGQYRRIIEQLPTSRQLPLAYLRVAMSQYNKKADIETLKAALALLKKFPDVPESTDALDLMEAVYDRNPKADFQKSLGEVITSVPGTPTAGEAQYRIAVRLFELKRYEEAAEAFQTFSVDFTGSPKLKKAQFLLAESYFNGGKHQEAVFAFDRYLTNFPSSKDTALALFHMGSSQYSLKRNNEAASAYQRLLDEYPDSEYSKAALYNVSLVYKSLGKHERAEEALTRYAALAGEDGSAVDALWQLFDSQKERKDFRGAISTLGRIEESSKSPEVLLELTYQRGEIYKRMGQMDEALRVWGSMVGMSPKKNNFRLQALINLGETYEERKEYASAVTVYADLCRNGTTQEVRAAACQRRDGLKQMSGGKGGGKKAAPKPKKKKKKKSSDINLPGMN